jgi:hypothetical protein
MTLTTCPDCEHRISDAAPACIFCGRPAVSPSPSSVASISTQPLASHDDLPSAQKSQPFFVPIAPSKLVVMYFVTFGLFGIHWFYRQWDYIRREHGRSFNPALRAVLAGVFAYPLFKGVRLRAEAAGGNCRWSPGLLYIVLIATSLSGAIFWPVAFLSVVPLFVVQRSINKLNDLILVENHYSKLNAFGIALGSILLLLAVVGSFMTGSK